MAVLSDVAVDVCCVDLQVPPAGHQLGRAAALLRRKVDAEGQLKGGEQLGGRLLKQI